MKKLIFLFALVGFFMLGMQSASAQTPVDYSFWVQWDDDDCSCGPILEKELSFEVKYIASGQTIDSGTIDVTSTSNPYEVLDNGPIFTDCADCYQVYAKVRYRDSEGWCCLGSSSTVCDGDDLIDGDVVYIFITME